MCGETFLVSRKGGSKFRNFDESAIAVALHQHVNTVAGFIKCILINRRHVRDYFISNRVINVDLKERREEREGGDERR